MEHGITESRYGIDLVERADRRGLRRGAAFTAKKICGLRTAPCRCASTAKTRRTNFAPNSGLISRYVSPGGPGVRLDSNICAGYEFPANYDSAGSLLIAYAP